MSLGLTFCHIRSTDRDKMAENECENCSMILCSKHDFIRTKCSNKHRLKTSQKTLQKKSTPIHDQGSPMRDSLHSNMQQQGISHEGPEANVQLGSSPDKNNIAHEIVLECMAAAISVGDGKKKKGKNRENAMKKTPHRQT